MQKSAQIWWDLILIFVKLTTLPSLY